MNIDKQNINLVSVECKKILKRNNSINLKKILKVLIKNKYIYKRDYAFWSNALIIESLILEGSNDSLTCVKKQYQNWKRDNFRIDYFDNYLMGYLFIKNSKIIEIENIDELENKLDIFLKNNNFEIYPYRFYNKNSIYIDILGMLPQYFSYKYLKTKDESFIEKAYNQFYSFKKNGLDTRTDLPYQVYNLDNDIKDGIVAWGRSLGWYLYGLSETMLNLNFSDKYYKLLLDLYLNTIESCIIYQRKDGGFSWQIIGLDSHLDTSATSMILLSLLILKDKGEKKIDKFNLNIEKMMNCIINSTIDGKVINCSAECGGVGVYPQIYSNYAWSNGPGLSCMLLYNKIYGELR